MLDGELGTQRLLQRDLSRGSSTRHGRREGGTGQCRTVQERGAKGGRGRAASGEGDSCEWKEGANCAVYGSEANGDEQLRGSTCISISISSCHRMRRWAELTIASLRSALLSSPLDRRALWMDSTETCKSDAHDMWRARCHR